MKRVRVEVPFIDKVTGAQYEANAEIMLTDERLAEIKSVNINMVTVLGDAEAEEPKKPRARKKKEE
jgi:hypothetical protein